MSDVVNLLDDLRVGDPITIEFVGRPKVYGRVSEFGGTPYRGTFPVIYLRTPHGSVLYAGRAYVHRIVSDEDRARLAEFDDEAKRANIVEGT